MMFIVIEQHTLLQLTVYIHILTVSSYLPFGCGAFKTFLTDLGLKSNVRCIYSTQTAYSRVWNKHTPLSKCSPWKIWQKE